MQPLTVGNYFLPTIAGGDPAQPAQTRAVRRHRLENRNLASGASHRGRSCSRQTVGGPAAKGRPVVGTALAARAEWLLTLNTSDFHGKLGREVCGLSIATPGEFCLEQGVRERSEPESRMHRGLGPVEQAGAVAGSEAHERLKSGRYAMLASCRKSRSRWVSI